MSIIVLATLGDDLVPSQHQAIIWAELIFQCKLIMN